MAEKNTRFRRVIAKLREGWDSGASGAEQDRAGRFVMKPGEIRIIKGGGRKLDRGPGEPRGE